MADEGKDRQAAGVECAGNGFSKGGLFPGFDMQSMYYDV